ncbi:hypothetical protein HHK36_026233 [Tetracentron sinense]|uniref:Retrotransposon gag domain-containing protein n=1 Tax=Tetracentron sinense TaxID=13715 RepID=A0A834YFN9_TETSI|nr:hypothetical protein HHK36_026233 [Tetracentron sinense]
MRKPRGLANRDVEMMPLLWVSKIRARSRPSLISLQFSNGLLNSETSQISSSWLSWTGGAVLKSGTASITVHFTLNDKVNREQRGSGVASSPCFSSSPKSQKESWATSSGIRASFVPSGSLDCYYPMARGRGRGGHGDPPQRERDIRDVEVEDLRRQVQQLTERVEQPNEGAEEDHVVRFDRFQDINMKVDIPEFEGKIRPEEFIDWSNTVERIFDYKEVPDFCEVQIVAIKLTKFALAWWEQLKIRMEQMRKAKITTWDKMKKELRKKNLPENYLQEWYVKMYNFQQGNKSVDEYTKEFDLLMIRCGVVEPEEQTIARYLGGLRKEIHDVVTLQPYWTYDDVYKLAIKVEKQQKSKSNRWVTGSRVHDSDCKEQFTKPNRAMEKRPIKNSNIANTNQIEIGSSSSRQDIGQIIVVREEGNNVPEGMEYRHGLTPPMGNAGSDFHALLLHLLPELVRQAVKDLVNIMASGTVFNFVSNDHCTIGDLANLWRKMIVHEEDGDDSTSNASKKAAAVPAAKLQRLELMTGRRTEVILKIRMIRCHSEN